MCLVRLDVRCATAAFCVLRFVGKRMTFELPPVMTANLFSLSDF